MSRRRTCSWHVRGWGGGGQRLRGERWAAPRILLTGCILPGFRLSLGWNAITVTPFLSFQLRSTADFHFLSSIAHSKSNQTSFFLKFQSVASFIAYDKTKCAHRHLNFPLFFPLDFKWGIWMSSSTGHESFSLPVTTYFKYTFFFNSWNFLQNRPNKRELQFFLPRKRGAKNKQVCVLFPVFKNRLSWITLYFAESAALHTLFRMRVENTRCT